MNGFVLLSVIGIGLVTVIGIMLVTVELVFSSTETSTPDSTTQLIDVAPTSGLALTETSARETTSLSHITPVVLLPTSTSTPKPSQTVEPTPITTYITCVYTIKPGDTLDSIAEKFGVESDSDIYCSSSGCTLYYPKELEAGWQVNIRNVPGYTCLQRGGGYP